MPSPSWSIPPNLGIYSVSEAYSLIDTSTRAERGTAFYVSVNGKIES